MALNGVHIVFGSVRQPPGTSAPLPIDHYVSQTLSGLSGVSTVAAPPGGAVLLSISTSMPIFYAIGPNPVADGSGPRRYLDPESLREDLFVNPGDKFAFLVA